MTGYIIVVTLTGVITGASMVGILRADGFFERIGAFILGFLVHVILTLSLTAVVYRVIEILGGVV